jgi:hypothetical protein
VVQDKLVLLRNEISAFSSGTIDEKEALAALTRLESTCGRMLAEATSQGWYLVDLISISTTFARAAATALRLNKRERAELLANEVLTRWLDFLPWFERGNDTKWVTDLARTPRTLANAILANVRGEAGPTDNPRAATEGIRQMLPAQRRRNAHIFALCGFEIAT